MTPSPSRIDRVATISLTKPQEDVIRRGFDPSKPFDVATATKILEKLHTSLRTSDIMLRRMDEPRVAQQLIDF
jgi:hypothetical protein